MQSFVNTKTNDETDDNGQPSSYKTCDSRFGGKENSQIGIKDIGLAHFPQLAVNETGHRHTPRCCM